MPLDFFGDEKRRVEISVRFSTRQPILELLVPGRHIEERWLDPTYLRAARVSLGCPGGAIAAARAKKADHGRESRKSRHVGASIHRTTWSSTVPLLPIPRSTF